MPGRALTRTADLLQDKTRKRKDHIRSRPINRSQELAERCLNRWESKSLQKNECSLESAHRGHMFSNHFETENVMRVMIHNHSEIIIIRAEIISEFTVLRILAVTNMGCITQILFYAPAWSSEATNSSNLLLLCQLASQPPKATSQTMNVPWVCVCVRGALLPANLTLKKSLGNPELHLNNLAKPANNRQTPSTLRQKKTKSFGTYPQTDCTTSYHNHFPEPLPRPLKTTLQNHLSEPPLSQKPGCRDTLFFSSSVCNVFLQLVGPLSSLLFLSLYCHLSLTMPTKFITQYFLAMLNHFIFLFSFCFFHVLSVLPKNVKIHALSFVFL